MGTHARLQALDEQNRMRMAEAKVLHKAKLQQLAIENEERLAQAQKEHQVGQVAPCYACVCAWPRKCARPLAIGCQEYIWLLSALTHTWCRLSLAPAHLFLAVCLSRLPALYTSTAAFLSPTPASCYEFGACTLPLCPPTLFLNGHSIITSASPLFHIMLKCILTRPCCSPKSTTLS